jgi:hypothetical protein
MIVLCLVMFGIQVGSLFGPLPENATELGVTGLVGFAGFAALAEWLDRKRG